MGIGLLVALSALPPAAGAARLPAGRQSPASLDGELEKGRQLLQRHDYFNALKQYQRANQLAGGRSADAFLGMALAAKGMKVFPNALDFAQSAIAFAAGNARLLARAHKLRGEVYDATGDPRGYETELRAALTADPDSHIADLHYELALALLQQHRDEEAIAELRQEIAIRPIGTTADEARALIANPRRGRETYAPEFSFTAADGRTISLASLHGKVVLLDFWASWCAPCVHALPAVKKVQKAHATDPFVVVGISADRDAGAWRAFVEKNGMVWPQFWDEDGRLRHLFDVEAIPTYVLVDAQGIERLRVSGAGFDEARALSAEIGKQIRLLASTPHP